MHPLGHQLCELVSLLLLLASSPIGMATDPTCEKLRTGQTLIRAFGYSPCTALSLFTSDGMVFLNIEPSRFDDNTHKLDLSGLTAQPIDVHYPQLQNFGLGEGFNNFYHPSNYPFLYRGRLAAFFPTKDTTIGFFDGTTTGAFTVTNDCSESFHNKEAVPVSLITPHSATVVYAKDGNQYCVRIRLTLEKDTTGLVVPGFDPDTVTSEVNKSCRPAFAQRPTAITYSGQWVYFFSPDGTVLAQEVRGLTADWTKMRLKVGMEEQLTMDSFINCGETVEEEIDDDKAKVKVRATTARPFFRTVLGFTVLCLGILLLVMGAGYYQFYYLPEVERKQKAAEAKAKGKGKMSALKGGRGKRPAKKKRRGGKLRSLWNSISSLASRSMVSKKKAISRSISWARSSVAKVLKRSRAPGTLSPISTPVSTTLSMASRSSAGKFSSGTPSSVLMKGLEEYRLKMARTKARTMKAKRRGRKGKGR